MISEFRNHRTSEFSYFKTKGNEYYKTSNIRTFVEISLHILVPVLERALSAVRLTN